MQAQESYLSKVLMLKSQVTQTNIIYANIIYVARDGMTRRTRYYTCVDNVLVSIDELLDDITTLKYSPQHDAIIHKGCGVNFADDVCQKICEVLGLERNSIRYKLI